LLIIAPVSQVNGSVIQLLSVILEFISGLLISVSNNGFAIISCCIISYLVIGYLVIRYLIISYEAIGYVIISYSINHDKYFVIYLVLY
jgi:hypothetical protein